MSSNQKLYHQKINHQRRTGNGFDIYPFNIVFLADLRSNRKTKIHIP